MKTKLLLSLFFMGFTLMTVAQEIKIDAIPYTMHFENTPADYKVLGKDQLQFSSPARSDLFYSSDGKYITNKSPRLLFEPDSNFVLSAKIQIDFHAKWDAGDLIMYNDERNWVKFCFEADFMNQPRVVSVVCNGFADDCNSMTVDENFVYYKIAGSLKTNKFNLYYSEDGKSWYPVRTFGLNKTDNLKIGFCVQSSIGEGSTATFSEIKYENREVKNWWTSE